MLRLRHLRKVYLVDMNKLYPLILSNTVVRLETPDLDPILDEYFGCHDAEWIERVDGGWR